MTAYTLYIGNKRYSSWSMRPWLLLKTLSIPFTESLQPFTDTGNAHRQPQFAAFSPTCKVPVLHHGPRVVWDSIAIAEYISEQAGGKGWPADVDARTWARCAAAEMHAGFAALREECGMNVGLRIELGDVGREVERDMKRVKEVFEEGLARFGGPFLAGGEFGIVDAFYAPVACRIVGFEGLEERVGEVAMGYVRTVLGVPAVEEWVRGGREEVFREAWSEEDTIRGRKVLWDSSKV